MRGGQGLAALRPEAGLTYESDRDADEKYRMRVSEAREMQCNEAQRSAARGSE